MALEPVSYQFPARVGGFDANWVVVAGTVSIQEGSWSFRESSLTTFEARGISTWLRSVAQGRVEATAPDDEGVLVPSLSFTEPDLAFSVAEQSNASVDLRVHLCHGYAPPWLDIDDRLNMWQFFVTVPLGANQLQDAADAWDRDWLAFPERP